MKLNIANPATGAQKVFEFDDERKLGIFYDKRMAAEVPADSLGDEWKGYVLKITGGNDKQGFPMKQGVLSNKRVRLLLSTGHTCYRPRRKGERKRKSVRGCIVDSNLSVLSLVVVRKGEKEIEGLTDKQIPRRLGPKRANKIRKLFNLGKEDDVRQYVIKRPLPIKEGAKSQKPRFKTPKIQRLVTPVRIQRKRHQLALKRKRIVARQEAAAEYEKMLQEFRRERVAKRKTEHEVRKRKRTATTSMDIDEHVASTGKKPLQSLKKLASDKTKSGATQVKKAQTEQVGKAGKKEIPSVQTASKDAGKKSVKKQPAKKK